MTYDGRYLAAKLWSCRELILDDVEPYDVTPYLYQEYVLNQDEVESLTQQTCRRQRALSVSFNETFITGSLHTSSDNIYHYQLTTTSKS